nr:putative reverse transcriptase domain-containing protein [Tanacetum cinerariifolium]
MSDSKDSMVTYTEVSSPFEDLSDIGSSGVDGLLMMPQDPYAFVEVALQAPPSPDYMPSPEHPPTPEFVLEPIYPEFMLPEDDVLPAEEQPPPTSVSPTANSPGYISESDFEEDDEDPKEDPTDYPTNRDDDDEDEEEEESSRDEVGDEDEDAEEEEYPDLADSVPPPAHHILSPLPQILSPPLPISSSPLPGSLTYPLGYRDAMIRLRAGEPSTSHPPPIIVLLHTRASVAMLRVAAPSTCVLAPQSETPPLGTPPLLPIPLPTSSPHLLLSSMSHRADVPKVTLPPWSRFSISLGLRFKVGESSSAPTTRLTGGFRADYEFVGTLDDEIRRDPERKVGYGITYTWDEMIKSMPGAPTTDETELGRMMTYFVTTVRQDTDEIYKRLDDAQDDRLLMSGQLNMLRRDRRAYARSARLMEREARLSREAWVQSMDASDTAHAETKEIQLFIFYITPYISWYQELKFLIKMPPKRNNNIYDVYERIMAIMDERLDQFIDQFANRMNDMMNPKRRGDRNSQRSEGEELENSFFEGDGSSLFVKCEEWEDDRVTDDDYEEGPIFDDDPYEEEIVSVDVGVNLVFKDELEMGDDGFVLIGEEVVEGGEIPEAMFPLLEEFSDVFPDELPDALPHLCDIQHHIDLEPILQSPNMSRYRLCPGEHEELLRQVKELVSKGHLHERMSLCAKPHGHLDLMSLYVFGSVPSKVHDFVEGLPYHGDSSDDDLVGNSRTNFVYPWGNDEGPSIHRLNRSSYLSFILRATSRWGPARGPAHPNELEEKLAQKRTTKSTLATTTTTTTTPVTNAQLKVVIDNGIADALAAHDANRSQNGKDGHDSGMGMRRQAPLASECTYQDFMKYKPLYFYGTEGVIELTQWFERKKIGFYISNQTIENQIKFATYTLLESALTWWNSHVKTVGPNVAYAMTWLDLKKKLTDKYCPRGEIRKLEVQL